MAKTVTARPYPIPAALYDRLRVVMPSPVVDLNRAIAHSMAFGPEAGLVSNGALNAESVGQWGFEGALQWDSLYTQAGYFGYDVDQRGAAPSYSFNGWYGEATWVLTGERRTYNSATASFTNPKPSAPFSFGGGWGAWELAARYSDLDLNDRAGQLGQPLPTDGLRGGDQRILTGALNWYPNNALKFGLQFQNVQISRIGTFQGIANSEIGQTYNTIALRSQIQF